MIIYLGEGIAAWKRGPCVCAAGGRGLGGAQQSWESNGRQMQPSSHRPAITSGEIVPRRSQWRTEANADGVAPFHGTDVAHAA